MKERRERALAIEDFQPIFLRDLRRGVGGRKRFNAADVCIIHVGQRAVTVVLVALPTNLGIGAVQKLPLCPTCGRVARILRVVPFGAGLGCQVCLRKQFAVKYAFQLRRNRGALPRPLKIKAPRAPNKPCNEPLMETS
jgi:hypothetical protein